MPRAARIVIPNVPHHITQRGNNRQDVFFTDDDRRHYLTLLQEHAEAAGVDVLGYCLMTNHVHLIIVPPDEPSLADTVGRTHFRYTQHVNRLYERSGHLWQGRFYSCPLDKTHLWHTLAHIERNPVRARLVRRPWRWKWSSAAIHVGDTHDTTGLLDLSLWTAEWTPKRWRSRLLEPADEGWTEQFRRAVNTGRPLAEDRWINRFESRLGQRLRPRPVGRPPKTAPPRRTPKTTKHKRTKT